MNAFVDDMVQSTGEKAGELSPMVLLLAAEGALSPSARVWGTGGWLQPEDREALDWLTLVRFLGWEVEVCVVDRGGRARNAPAGPRASHHHRVRSGHPQRSTARRDLRRTSRPSEFCSSAAGRLQAARWRNWASSQAGRVRRRANQSSGADQARRQTLFFKNPFEVRRLSVHRDAVTWASAADVPLVTARACGRGARRNARRFIRANCGMRTRPAPPS